MDLSPRQWMTDGESANDMLGFSLEESVITLFGRYEFDVARADNRRFTLRRLCLPDWGRLGVVVVENPVNAAGRSGRTRELDNGEDEIDD